jgi:hypothetical protein
MILGAFTLFHVGLSLAGIVLGFVVLAGFLTSKEHPGRIKWFLITTVATNVTGLLFPFHGFLPSYGVAILSLVVLCFAMLALYRFHLANGWRTTWVISSMVALYFNVFVLIAQMFQKIPSLKELAPTQSEPPFQITQVVVLILFIALIATAVSKVRKQPARRAVV